MGASSSAAFGTAILAVKPGMDLGQRRIKSPGPFREGSGKSSPPPDQHIVVAGTHNASSSRKSHRLAQAAANPVALDRAARLPRNRETDAHGPLISSTTRLQDEGPICRPHSAGGGPKIAPAS